MFKLYHSVNNLGDIKRNYENISNDYGNGVDFSNFQILKKRVQ